MAKSEKKFHSKNWQTLGNISCIYGIIGSNSKIAFEATWNESTIQIFRVHFLIAAYLMDANTSESAWRRSAAVAAAADVTLEI